MKRLDLRDLRDRLLQQEDLNFLLTNRVPRLALTRFMGWFSQIRQPWVSAASIRVWRLFTELDLREAKKTHFDSLHDCFTRELRPGARPFDPDPQVLASPCDGIVGACGSAQGLEVFQAKGFPYRVEDLFGSAERAAPFRNGTYVTLRLTSAMYHRFHAPHDGRLQHVTHLAGDTWNVNPIALKRVERLFCRNERAALHARLDLGGHPIALVPVAAILVASLRLHFLDLLLHGRYPGPHELPCDAPMHKGQELGWFQHGSTIIVFAPPGFALCEGIAPGQRLRAGQPLMRLPRGDKLDNCVVAAPGSTS
ncbi:archaetidylserine decarboxylase [Curvibacter sp. RS43]|uniref:phosphatidylserine decarboxylase n=1 Tax=Curvibacter microcysteis TaxID=3026419 RepID=A0ABT5MJS5_9BURK|nr:MULTISPECIES: archaetidylserine decarboxylase [unclassified Curvibacter]MDD0810305.1 archaetidylserine decarboxylase [Curvibacter sp. RS43]MDD0816259.1 archaetidylserine decarboxylase [Curvibacter sp. HBC28]